MRRTCVLLFAVLAFAATHIAAAASDAGSPDSDFGQGGQAIVDVPGYEYPRAVAVLRDGGLAMALETDGGLIVAKLNSRGGIDESFGVRGLARILSGKAASVPAVFAARDGGVVIVGWVSRAVAAGVSKPRLLLMKLRPDGRRDLGYGQADGLVDASRDYFRPLGPGPVAAAMARDGGVVVLGLSGASLGYFGYPSGTTVLRFLPDGRLDPGFGVAGSAVVDVPSALPGSLHAAVDSKDRVVVGATDFTLAPAVETMRVTRLTRRGLLDATFGRGGVAMFTFGSDWNVMTDLVVDRFDRVNVVGFGSDGPIGAISRALLRPSDQARRFTPGLARLTKSGRLDAGFGGDGVVVIERDQRGRELLWSDSVAVDDQGRLVFDAFLAGKPYATLLRAKPNGEIDESFQQPLRLPIDSWMCIAIHAGRVLLAGFDEISAYNQAYRTVVAAYRM